MLPRQSYKVGTVDYESLGYAIGGPFWKVRFGMRVLSKTDAARTGFATCCCRGSTQEKPSAYALCQKTRLLCHQLCARIFCVQCPPILSAALSQTAPILRCHED